MQSSINNTMHEHVVFLWKKGAPKMTPRIPNNSKDNCLQQMPARLSGVYSKGSTRN